MSAATEQSVCDNLSLSTNQASNDPCPTTTDDHSSTTQLASDDPCSGVVEPKNFSWSVKDKLSACGLPSTPAHLRYLLDHNVACLISLTAETVVSRHDIPEDQLAIEKLDVQDYTSPTPEQIDRFLELVNDYNNRGKAVCVHCAHGLGRTGTMLACYWVTRDLTPEEAIEKVRGQRPGSLETPDQEMTIFHFHKNFNKSET